MIGPDGARNYSVQCFSLPLRALQSALSLNTRRHDASRYRQEPKALDVLRILRSWSPSDRAHLHPTYTHPLHDQLALKQVVDTQRGFRTGGLTRLSPQHMQHSNMHRERRGTFCNIFICR